MADYIKVGKITSTHGLKGEVKVYFNTDAIDEYFQEGKELYLLDENGQYLKQTVAHFYMIPSGLGLMILKGYDSIEKIEPFLKRDLFAVQKKIENRIYLKDLIGFKVMGTQGQELGTVSSFETIAGKLYLVIGDKYLPYVLEKIIVSADMGKKELNISEQGEEMIENA
jgi:16S rRNA processing protein RimM